MKLERGVREEKTIIDHSVLRVITCATKVCRCIDVVSIFVTVMPRLDVGKRWTFLFARVRG